MMPERRLLSVHAHPDDEASKGAGTVARYREQGARSVLVCATGGEAGDILNPAMNRPDVRRELSRVRFDELTRAVQIIGYDELVMLGYLDSGMPGTTANADPRNFANAPLEEAVGRLVGVIRQTKPHVILTYGEDQRGYPHPDHLRVHEITLAAWDAAPDPGCFPGFADPWTPLKLYYHVWSTAMTLARHRAYLELGIESPFKPEWIERDSNDHLVTTRIDIGAYEKVVREALLCHATQIDPGSPWWFGLPHGVYPFEEYQLAASRVATALPENDLFAGIG